MRLKIGIKSYIGRGGGGSQPTPVDPSLRLWIQGSSVDKSDDGRDLTLYSGAAFSGSGPISTPLVLDGTSDYADFTEAVFSGAFTIAFWCNKNLQGDFIFGEIDANDNYISWNTNNDLRLNITANQIWADVVEDNAGWNHYAITRGAGLGTCNLYVNKVKQTAFKDITGDFDLSAVGRILGGGYYTGGLDDIRMYDKQISQSEVDALYDAAFSGTIQADIFMLAGQSNCEGQGDSAKSPGPLGGLIYESSALNSADDPLGSADTGSMWPSFAKQWYLKTGRRAIFINGYQDGSALDPVADTGFGDYSPTGALRGAAVTEWDAAVAWISANTSYTINTHNIIWCQGENDAFQIHGGGMTGEDYETQLEALAAWWKTETSMDQMYVIQSGRKVSGNQDTGYTALRTAQTDACTDSANLTMTFTGAVDFSTSGKMVDDVHWDQVGLNEAGNQTAILVAQDKGF